MQGIKWGFTCVFTQCVKSPDDPDEYRTGYDVMQIIRIQNAICLNTGNFIVTTNAQIEKLLFWLYNVKSDRAEARRGTLINLVPEWDMT